GRGPEGVVAEVAAGAGSIVEKVAATAPLGFPQAVTSEMEANRRAPIVLRLVLDLGLQDRLLACRAGLIPSATGPQLHRALARQRAAVELVPDEISQRLRHCTSP